MICVINSERNEQLLLVMLENEIREDKDSRNDFKVSFILCVRCLVMLNNETFC